MTATDSNSIRALKAEPLSHEKFKDYGDVIAADTAQSVLEINQGYTTRFHDLANIDVSDANGRVCLSLFRSTPFDGKVVIERMERHPLGSQAFIPLQGRPYLIVVAPPGEFQETRVRAFVANGDQGVNYAKGVWHHFLLALEEKSDFLVIDREGPGDNLDEIELPVGRRFAVTL